MVRLAALTCVAVVALAAASANAATQKKPVSTVTRLPSSPQLFGDPILADLDILVDTKRVDPRAVRVDTKFDPYTRLKPAQRTRTTDGTTTRLRYRYLLTCDTFACITEDKAERWILFAPATVRYRDRRGKSTKLTATWLRFRLVSRFGGPRYLPQTASQVTQGIQYSNDPIIRLFASVRAAAPSFRLDPTTIAVFLFVAAAAALLGAGQLARPLVALVRRRDIDTGPELTPLERALAAVDTAIKRQPGSAEHREALAWLARELRRTNMPELVSRSRRLAWSEQPPTADASRELAADVEAAKNGGAS
jgi:hypothetical protein